MHNSNRLCKPLQPSSISCFLSNASPIPSPVSRAGHRNRNRNARPCGHHRHQKRPQARCRWSLTFGDLSSLAWMYHRFYMDSLETTGSVELAPKESRNDGTIFLRPNLEAGHPSNGTTTCCHWRLYRSCDHCMTRLMASLMLLKILGPNGWPWRIGWLDPEPRHE